MDFFNKHTQIHFICEDTMNEDLEKGTQANNGKIRANEIASFLMRPPVREEEVDLVENGVTTYFQKAMEILNEKGVDALLESGFINLVDMSNGNGLESDDEDENERIKKSIEEAIVRGNPRLYQIALFERAKERNTIVNLGTGQGKTLIALLCIQHFSKPAYDEGKKTLFLVPSIALAVQHTTTLKANLPFKVSTACHTSSNSDMAREEIKECNILVATHGAALDILRHYGDYFSLSNVNLIVVDECHYTTGNHGYARIMEMFYHKLPKAQRPRVLGLTASPLVNVRPETTKEKLEELLSQLEMRLDAELACFSSLGLEVLGGKEKENNEPNYGLKVSSAEERVVQYFNGKPETKFPCHERVGLHYSRIKELNQLIILYAEYGKFDIEFRAL